jgi:hypothetical protein
VAEWFVRGVRAEWLEGHLFDNEVGSQVPCFQFFLYRLLLLRCLYFGPEQVRSGLLEVPNSFLIDLSL